MAPRRKRPKRSRDSAVSSSKSNEDPRPGVLENYFKKLKPSQTNQELQIQEETTVQESNVLEPIQEPNFQVPSVQLHVQDQSVPTSNVLQRVPQHSDPETESSMLELVYDPGLRPSIYSYDHDGKGLENIRKAYLLKGPSQPKDHAFKKTDFSGRSRAFNPEWYTMYPNWLEYSTSKDGVFCLYCYLFKPEYGKQGGGGTFVTKGFKNWKKATEKLKEHVGKVDSSHNKCYIMCRDLLNSKQHIDRTLAKLKPSQTNQEPQVQETTVQEPNMLEPIQEPNFQVAGIELPVQDQSVPTSNVLPRVPQHSDPETESSMSELVYDPGLRPSIYSYARDGKGLENIRKAYLLKGPSQPKNYAFKKTNFSGKSRAFNPKCYTKYANWLEYSTSKDGIFCLFCYLFKPEYVKQGGGTFVTKGFKNWKKATEKLKEHVGKVNSSHNKCYVMCRDLLNSKQHIDLTLAKLKPSQSNSESQVQETTVQEPNMVEQIQEPNFQVSGVQLPVLDLNVPSSNVLRRVPPHLDPQTESSISELVYDPGLRPSIYSYARDGKGLENIRMAYLLKGPSQPKEYAFKKTNFSGTSRAFNLEWYTKYSNWLEYSTSKDGAFCLFCYLFKPEHGKQGGGGTFVTKGFRNWKKATEKFKEHVGKVNSSHNKCYVMCQDLLNSKQQIDRTLAKVSDKI